MKTKKILGLDVGTNSLGWALILEDADNKPIDIIDFNSHIFSSPVEDKNKRLLNAKRREARGARRRFERRSRRIQKLRNLLIRNGFFTGNERPPQDIYQLRKRALTQPVPLSEFAFLLLNFAKRRGFLSNRKTRLGSLLHHKPVQDLIPKPKDDIAKAKSDSEEKEEKGLLAEIENLQQAINDHETPLLGAYLADLPEGERKRGKRTERSMYQAEFEALWQVQSIAHPKQLTPQLKQEIYNIVFHQRPLKQAGLRGYCSLEPQRKRAAKAWPQCQEFRLWQTLANLTYVDPETGVHVALTLDQKQTLAEQLQTQESMTFGAIRKQLGIKSAKAKFNLELEKNKDILGNKTRARMIKVLPEWATWPQQQQLEMIEDLITIKDKKVLFERLNNHWQMPRETAFNLSCIEFEAGYTNLSLKAVKRLLPHLKAGLKYSEARQKAGYTYALDEPDENEKVTLLPMPPDIANPVVKRSLNRMHLVVNEVINTWGPLDGIRIEMAREVKLSNKRLQAIEKQQTANKKQNEAAEAAYKDLRSSEPHLNLSENMPAHLKLKYRLWQEQDHMCIYTPGERMGLTEVFSAGTEIDHILPFRKSMDDSYMNKVLCYRDANQKKGNRLPLEWLGDDKERRNHMRVISSRKNYPQAKRKRLFGKSMEAFDGFLKRQLSDTAYIARETGKYLQQLGVKIDFTKGQYTHWLARQWGLHNLLPKPVNAKDEKEAKNRRDHRHHALDALVVAFTSRRLFKQIHEQARRLEETYHDVGRHQIKIQPPLEHFRQRVEDHLCDIVVTHAPRRRLKGRLHEESVYGLWRKPEGGFALVKRELINSSFTEKMAEKVLDKGLRDALVSHYAQGKKISDEQPFRFNNAPLRHTKLIVANTFDPKSYVVLGPQPSQTELPLKVMALGEHHHVEIYRHIRKANKFEVVFRSQLEVALRTRKGITHDEFRADLQAAIANAKGRKGLAPIASDIGPDWEFVMALHRHDLVKVKINDEWQVYRVAVMEGPNNLTIRLHSSAESHRKGPGVLRLSAGSLIKNYQLMPVRFNILGHSIDDEASESEMGDDQTHD